MLVLCITGISVEDCRALSTLLLSSESLNCLDITSLDIDKDAIQLIICGLHLNTKLKTLIMRFPHFSFQNTMSLTSMLRTNPNLVKLTLRKCNVESDGACHIANALHTNNTLQKLNLEDNPVGVEGATALAEMLLKNTSLKKLDVRDDSIGEEGTLKLIDSLKHNITLEKLTLPRKYQLSIASSEVDGSRVEFD